MDYLDSNLHASILSSLAANLASSSSQDDLGLLTSTFDAITPVSNGAIHSVLQRLEVNGNGSQSETEMVIVVSFDSFACCQS